MLDRHDINQGEGEGIVVPLVGVVGVGGHPRVKDKG